MKDVKHILLNVKLMKKCIFVVEDNPSIREIIEFLLTEELYEVKACSNISDFWNQMRLNIPDMVILDIMLPDGNGIEICTQLKANVKTHHIPVMMMSANNHLNAVKAKCTAEDFINKPFDLNDFAGRVERYLPN
jgi:DNA-binding response OmpR family regulator